MLRAQILSRSQIAGNVSFKAAEQLLGFHHDQQAAPLRTHPSAPRSGKEPRQNKRERADSGGVKEEPEYQIREVC